MEDFTFYEGDAGEPKALEFEPSFYHTPDFFLLKAPSGWKWYYGVRARTKKVAISFYIHLTSSLAQSSIQSPFGTIECSDDVLPEAIFRFLEFVEERLFSVGVTKITIKNQPALYSEKKNSLIETFLYNRGYVVTDAEIGAIRFASTPFEDGLNKLATRQLRKCLDNRLTVAFHSTSELETIYSFILHCRQSKNYSLSMTLDLLRRDVSQFPNRYILVSVQKDNAIIGAAIAVRVSSEVLYNFYADHDPKYNAISPVVLVVKALYEYCQEQKMKMLDMGTSAINGKPNFGLLNLKMRLGAMPSPKLTFEKLLT